MNVCTKYDVSLYITVESMMMMMMLLLLLLFNSCTLTLFNVFDFYEILLVTSSHCLGQLLSLDFWAIDISL